MVRIVNWKREGVILCIFTSKKKKHSSTDNLRWQSTCQINTTCWMLSTDVLLIYQHLFSSPSAIIFYLWWWNPNSCYTWVTRVFDQLAKIQLQDQQWYFKFVTYTQERVINVIIPQPHMLPFSHKPSKSRSLDISYYQDSLCL